MLKCSKVINGVLLVSSIRHWVIPRLLKNTQFRTCTKTQLTKRTKLKITHFLNFILNMEFRNICKGTPFESYF